MTTAVAELTVQELRHRREDQELVEYSELMRIISRHTKHSKKVKLNQKYPKWSVEIRAPDKIRKDLGKQLRVARKQKDATGAREINQQCQKATRDVSRLIAEEIPEKDHMLMI